LQNELSPGVEREHGSGGHLLDVKEWRVATYAMHDNLRRRCVKNAAAFLLLIERGF